MLAVPFNKYCVDCKRNKTSHGLAWLGALVCLDCGGAVVVAAGDDAENSPLTDVVNGPISDEQVAYFEAGGNEKLFHFMREYNLQNESIAAVFSKSSMKWYRGHLQATVTGEEFK